MKLVGANASAAVTGADELPGKSNYFIGNDPKKWRTNVPNYGKVKYVGVYPGVDLVYYGNQRQLEYDLVVAPGTDPSVIKLDVGAALPSQGGPRPRTYATEDWFPLNRQRPQNQPRGRGKPRPFKSPPMLIWWSTQTAARFDSTSPSFTRLMIRVAGAT